MTTIAIDVLVCGGGCAGLGAAVAAARAGARVLLIERAPFSGGIMTAVGLPFMDGIFCWHTNRIVVRGLALEFLVRLGCAPANAQRLEDFPPARVLKSHSTALVDSIERFKLVADDLLQEAGVRVLYHSMACAVETRGGRIETVMLANKDGLVRVTPSVVIDATGDADIAHWAGCPMEITERMPMTLHFRIGNVDYARVDHQAAKQSLVWAREAGLLAEFYGPGFGANFAHDEAYIHAVRVNGNGVDAADLTRAEIQARRDAWTISQTWKQQVRGFEDSYYITSGPYLGVRETRRIRGQHVLCEDDLRTCRRFEDAIATGAWYTDIHPQQTTVGGANGTDTFNTEQKGHGAFTPKPYDIPLRSLQPLGIANLLVAGRCHSASRMAGGSTRVTVTAMALGEAAGMAAALAVAQKRDVNEIKGSLVRDRLAAAGGGPFTDAPALGTGSSQLRGASAPG
jgi:hypothetical protein